MNLIFSILLISQSFAGGVGGLSGGSIHFQKAALRVSPLNPTLCHDEEFFYVEVKHCRGRDNCIIDSGRKILYQPLRSEKIGCLQRGNNSCATKGMVPFFQSPIRLMKRYNSRGMESRESIEVVVPRCDN